MKILLIALGAMFAATALVIVFGVLLQGWPMDTGILAIAFTGLAIYCDQAAVWFDRE